MYAVLFIFMAMAGTEPVRVVAGPMIGHVDAAQAAIWVQTNGEAQVHLRFWPQKEAAKVSTSAVSSMTASGEFCAVLILPNLAENTTYTYEVVVNDTVQKFPYPTEVTTQPLWRWRADPPTVRVALGSCLYINDPPYDRPGKPYGVTYGTLSEIAKRKPDVMLWLGDNIYLRETEFTQKERMAYRYRHTRAFPQLQPLLASCAHYATWDDHDFGPNDSDRSFPLKGASLELFKQYWANPSYGLPETPGVFTLVSRGDVDIFLLDDRYYRAPSHGKSPNRPHFGAAQLQWLKDSLIYSQATFKVIVNGGQMLNIYDPNESLYHHREEYDELLAFLESEAIPGVLFVSGDRHFSELLKLERQDTYPLYEFTCSPLSSGMSALKGEEVSNPMRVPGKLVADTQNFGWFEVTGPPKNRVLQIQIIDHTGRLRWEHRIRAEELR